jgi:hypothetical protein
VARKRDQTQKMRRGFGKIPHIRAFKVRLSDRLTSRCLERESVWREALSRSTVTATPPEGFPSPAASPPHDGPPLPLGGGLCPSADGRSRDRPHLLPLVPRTGTSSPPLQRSSVPVACWNGATRPDGTTARSKRPACGERRWTWPSTSS